MEPTFTTARDSSDQPDAGDLLTELETSMTDRPASDIGNSRAPGGTSVGASSPYDRVVLALVPGWRRIIGSAPWWRVARSLKSLSAPQPSQIQYRLSAALGLVLSDQIEQEDLVPASGGSARDNRLHHALHDEVRAELVQWRSAVDPDGRPKQLRARGSPLWPVVAQQVVRLLESAPSFQTTAMLDDLDRHLRWLVGTRPRTSWVEAALVEALGRGAVLIRETKLLHRARERLEALLNRQNAEGWFPERGGADLGRLSLMLDSLAPLWCDYGWDELGSPLEKAVQFLGVLIEVDAADVPCINTRGTGFVVPFGLERLGARKPYAAYVAAWVRERMRNHVGAAGASWDDERTAVLGSSIALAAAFTGQHRHHGDSGAPSEVAVVPVDSELPDDDVVISGAGLHIMKRPAYRAVVASRQGGHVFIQWKNGLTLEDGGVSVVFPHTIRTSGRPGMSDPIRCDANVLSWRGLLTRVRRKRPGIMLQLWRGILRVLFRRRKRTVSARFHRDGARGRQRLLHDWFSREIAFGDSEVHIRDQVLCRLPCEAVVVGDASGPAAVGRRWGSSPDAIHQAPVIVEGGRAVAISRTYCDGELTDVSVERQVDLV
jgi:hypothetical protein